MNEYICRYGFDITENMGRAIGIGFCYVNTKFDREIYLYINLWKYNLAIGRFYH